MFDCAPLSILDLHPIHSRHPIPSHHPCLTPDASPPMPSPHLIHRGFAPPPRVIAERGRGRDGGVQPGDFEVRVRGGRAVALAMEMEAPRGDGDGGEGEREPRFGGEMERRGDGEGEVLRSALTAHDKQQKQELIASHSIASLHHGGSSDHFICGALPHPGYPESAVSHLPLRLATLQAAGVSTSRRMRRSHNGQTKAFQSPHLHVDEPWRGCVVCHAKSRLKVL